MVANNFLGRLRSLDMIANAMGCSSVPVSKSDLVKEKSATSAPEISAEQKSKMKSKISPEIKDVFPERSITIKLVGSGSKIHAII